MLSLECTQQWGMTGGNNMGGQPTQARIVTREQDNPQIQNGDSSSFGDDDGFGRCNCGPAPASDAVTSVTTNCEYWDAVINADFQQAGRQPTAAQPCCLHQEACCCCRNSVVGPSVRCSDPLLLWIERLATERQRRTAALELSVNSSSASRR